MPGLFPVDQRSVQQAAPGRLHEEVPRHQVPVHRGFGGDRHVSRHQVLRGRSQEDERRSFARGGWGGHGQRQDRPGPGRRRRDGAGQDALQDEHVHRPVQSRRWQDPLRRHRERQDGRSEGMLTDAGPGLGAAPARTRMGRQVGRARAFRRVLPWVEAAALIVALAVPIVLSERTDLVTLATNVLILSMLAISFDLCWGYSGIMSFGQALFFGVAGYVVGLVGRDLDFSPLWGTLPLAMAVGLCLSLLFASLLLLGRKTPTAIFVAFGTLTGSYAADLLVSGWQYVGAGNGLSAIKLLQIGPVEMVEGIPFYCLVFAILACCYLGCRLLVRSQFGLVL